MMRFNPWVRKIPWRRAWQPTPVFLPGEFHGQGSLVGYSLWGHKESDMTKRLHFLFFFQALPCSGSPDLCGNQAAGSRVVHIPVLFRL